MPPCTLQFSAYHPCTLHDYAFTLYVSACIPCTYCLPCTLAVFISLLLHVHTLSVAHSHTGSSPCGTEDLLYRHMARTALRARRHFIRRQLRRGTNKQLRKTIRRLLRYITSDLHHYIPFADLRALLGGPIEAPPQAQQGAPVESDAPPRALTSSFDAAIGGDTQT